MYAFGPFSLDPRRRLLMRHGQAVAITARAFDVLLTLVERSGETVAKDELLRTVWPDTIVEDANISQQIFTLRKTLGQTEEQAYIATVPRRGYRWVAPVRHAAEASDSRAPVQGKRAERTVTTRLEIPLHAGISLPETSCPLVAISPEGSRIVYVASDGSTTRLYLRPLDRFEAVPLAQTEGAVNPFFSPDGQWVGYQCGRRLLKISLQGGPPIPLCDVADMRGAAWTHAGEIVFAPGPATGLWRVPEEGGAPAPLTTLDFHGGERTHRWPHTLADGRVIFTIGSAGAASFDDAMLAITSGNGQHQIVLQHATDGRQLADGRLVWVRGATLYAAPFDLSHGRLDGTPRVVQQSVATSATGVAHFACARNGTLVHVDGGAQSLQRWLVTVDRRGAEIARHVNGHSLEEPRVAADGRAAIINMRSGSSDLWLYDFCSRALMRLTFDGENFAGIWGPERDTITYSSSHGGASDLFLLRSDRSVPSELLVASEFDKVAGSWSPDGNTLVFTEYHPDTGADLWVLHRDAERARPLVVTRFNEYAPSFSPNGRYLAYVTDASGRAEVVVISYPEAAGKRQVSIEGGAEPMWSRDGMELFYRSGDRLMCVNLSRGLGQASIPTTLFEGRFVRGSITLPNYDIAGNGSEFVMVVADVAPPPRALRVTTAWSAVD